MKKNSRGFTLVELVVVVTILGVLAGLISLSVSSIYSARAKRCASEINSYISMCKVNSLSRAGQVYIILDTDGGGRIRGRYYEDEDTVPDEAHLRSTEIFSDARVTGVYLLDSGDEYDLSSHSLTLSFDRGSGAFKPVDAANNYYCTAIRISGVRTYVINLTPSTGSHSID